MQDFRATRRVSESDGRTFLEAHKVCLVVNKGPKAGRTFDLTQPRITIGRADTAEIGLEDGKASRIHVVLTLNADAFELKDVNSTNGTWVNGRRVEACRLEDGDMIRIGDSLLRYVID